MYTILEQSMSDGTWEQPQHINFIQSKYFFAIKFMQMRKISVKKLSPFKNDSCCLNFLPWKNF